MSWSVADSSIISDMPRVDDALQFIISSLREPRSRAEAGGYGYDVYIPKVSWAYARDVEKISPQDSTALERRARELTGGVFYDAAWELCRRGILRPSVRNAREQSTVDGSAGNGYAITAAGSAWIADAEHAVFIPTEPSRVAELMGRFRADFGDGFFQRAQEAVKCHSATAYLACCVMCGAATESILLSLAIAKSGDEESVLKTYHSASGRRRTENLVLAGVPEPLAGTFRNLMDLLKYWRDDASHGTASEISEFEAYEALARLLRFAHFAMDHRTELTA
jgi:hypothetical protein